MCSVCVFGVCVRERERAFGPVIRARTESQEEESGPAPSFMKPAHRTESPSPQMTSSPLLPPPTLPVSPPPPFTPPLWHRCLCTSSCFVSSVLRSFLSFWSVSSAVPLSLLVPLPRSSSSATLGRGYVVASPSSPDSQPFGSDYLDNPHPFLFYEFALD